VSDQCLIGPISPFLTGVLHTYFGHMKAKYVLYLPCGGPKGESAKQAGKETASPRVLKTLDKIPRRYRILRYWSLDDPRISFERKTDGAYALVCWGEQPMWIPLIKGTSARTKPRNAHNFRRLLYSIWIREANLIAYFAFKNATDSLSLMFILKRVQKILL